MGVSALCFWLGYGSQGCGGHAFGWVMQVVSSCCVLQIDHAIGWSVVISALWFYVLHVLVTILVVYYCFVLWCPWRALVPVA